MKTIWKNPKSLFVLLATTLMTSSVMVSCDKDDELDDNEKMYTLSGSASGAQEIPANAVSGTATLTGSYNARTNSLNYTINWMGLSNVVTAAHFHGPASATETASPVVDISIGTNGMNGSATGTVILNDATEAALLSGKIYYNLHTALYPDGEVRSQVTTTQQ